MHHNCLQKLKRRVKGLFSDPCFQKTKRLERIQRKARMMKRRENGISEIKVTRVGMV